MKIKFLLLLTIFSLNFAISQTLQTVANVDLKRFAGKWYEIASYPTYFQKNCTCTTAEYTITNADYIIVENRCKKYSCTGKQSYIAGKAFVQPNTGNSKLKIQFFWPFKSDYWIVILADDYNHAVISNADKDYLWILSRTPKMSDDVYKQVTNQLKEKGFDLTKLKITKQI